MTRTHLYSVLLALLTLLLTAQAWAGGYKPPVNYSAGTNPQSVFVADVDGDGHADLIIVNQGGNSLTVLLGDGTGAFPASTTITGVGSGPVAITGGCFKATCQNTVSATVDFLAVSSPGDNKVYLVKILNTTTAGSPQFSAPAAIAGYTGTTPSGLAVGDLDRDGNTDIAVANHGSDDVTILTGNGSGTFTLGTPIGGTISSNTVANPVPVGAYNGTSKTYGCTGSACGPVALVVRDLSGSGGVDMAVVDQTSGQVSVLINVTAGNGNNANQLTFVNATLHTVGTNPVAIASADLDGQNRVDLVVANQGSNNASVLLSTGNGTFGASATNYAIANSGSPTGVVLIDINADGHNDIVVSDSNGVDTLLNDGTGVFATPSTNYTANSNPTAIASGLFNAGTKPDLAVTDGTGNSVSVLLGSPFTITPAAISATEGADYNGNVARFTHDGNPAANTITASIDWGQTGTISGNPATNPVSCAAPCAQISGPTSNVYTLTGGGFNYDDALGTSPTVTVTLTDAGGESFAATTTATLNDAALTGINPPDLGPLAPGAALSSVGAAPANTLVAQFTDANSKATTAEFDVDINWGDGTAHTTCTHSAAPPNCGSVGILSFAAGTFSVNADHTYATGPAPNPSFTVTTAVTDFGGGATPSPTPTTHVFVTSIGATLGNGLPINTVEGTPLTNLTLANITSSTTHATGQYAATINWGDGTDSCPGANCTITDTGTGNCAAGCTLTGSHTYAKFDAAFPVTIKITDKQDSSEVDLSSTAAVTDAALNPNVAQPGAVIGTEGTPFGPGSVAVGAFSDGNTSANPATDFTVTVHWNDKAGTTNSGVVSGSNGNFTISANPDGVLYDEEGNYQITFDVSDVAGTPSPGNKITGANGASVTINDAALVNPATVNIGTVANPIILGDKYTGSLGSFHDNAGASTKTADFDSPSSLVNWGDGTTDPCSSVAANTPNCVIHVNTSNGNVTIDTGATGGHIFQKAGTQEGNVVVTIFDVALPAFNPQSVTITNPTHVSSVASISGVSDVRDGSNNEPLEGNLFTPNSGTGAGSFVSKRAGAVINDFTATLDWGDGKGAQPATVVATGTAGTFLITGSVTYLDEGGPNIIKLSVTDNLDGSNLATGTVANPNGSATVKDAPLTIVGAVQPVVPGQGVTCYGAANTVYEGCVFGPIQVGAFIDSNPLSPNNGSDFTTAPGSVVVDWKDGTKSCAPNPNAAGCDGHAVSVVLSGAQFVIISDHQYMEPNTGGAPYQVTFDVTDKGGAAPLLGQNGISIQVNDAPLSGFVAHCDSPPVPGCQNLSSSRGQNVLVTIGTFNDANTSASSTAGDFTVDINWGDGTIQNGLTGVVTKVGTGQYQVAANHQYNTANVIFTITGTVHDVDGASVLFTTQASTQAAGGGGISQPYVTTSNVVLQTVKAGSSVDYQLTLSPVPGGFPFEVDFSCINLPAGTHCTFNPPSVADVNTVQNVKLTVDTSGVLVNLHPPRFGNNLRQLALWLPASGFGLVGIFFLTPGRRSKRARKIFFLSTLALLLLAVAAVGCGGGGGGGGGGTPFGNQPITINMASPAAPQGQQVQQYQVIIRVVQ